MHQELAASVRTMAASKSTNDCSLPGGPLDAVDAANPAAGLAMLGLPVTCGMCHLIHQRVRLEQRWSC